MSDPVSTNTVTCHTDGCDNNGVPIEMTLSWTETDIDGQLVQHTVSGVVCGVCGQPITDIAPPLPSQSEPNQEAQP
jgi:hypothetical protein